MLVTRGLGVPSSLVTRGFGGVGLKPDTFWSDNPAAHLGTPVLFAAASVPMTMAAAPNQLDPVGSLPLPVGHDPQPVGHQPDAVPSSDQDVPHSREPVTSDPDPTGFDPVEKDDPTPW